MKVLNIEDNVFKHSAICNTLKKVGVNSVAWKRNLSEAIEELTSATEPYDLVITDMWYPEYPGGPDAQSGKVFIEKYLEHKWNIKVILCSSVDYLWPDILGSIHYSEDSDWENELQALIRKARQYH